MSFLIQSLVAEDDILKGEGDSTPAGIGSPRNYKASMMLLDLAAKKKGDNEITKTPKHAFLKRLDDPECSHQQLVLAKEKLTGLLERAMKNVGHVRPSAFELVRSQLLTAVEKLEQNTTIAKKAKEWLPPDM